MPQPSVPSDNAPSTAKAQSGAKTRRRAAAFIVIFVATVFASLAGYRFAIDTYANQWYLFQVARHTSWLLDRLGHSSELEPAAYLDGEAGRVRAEIAAMAAGKPMETADVYDESDDAPPLTPWEVWRYRALRIVRGEHHPAPPQEERSLRNQGPVVFFIAEPSLELELEQARRELEAERGAPVPGEAPTPEVAQLQARVDRLTAELRERQESGDYAPSGKLFRFRVVPDCGAIEVMAIYLAAILAFPAPWKKRLLGLVAGIPLLYGLNLVRLSFLAFVGAWTNGGAWFDFAHHYVWQGIYIVFVVAVWLAWMEFIVRKRA